MSKSNFFPYHFESWTAVLLRAAGVRPDRDGVEIDAGQVTASFGPLHTRFKQANIESVTSTGPYSVVKAIGPRLSLADWGLTFGTTSRGGVCIRFHDPIKPVIGFRPHPGLTVTVEDVAGLVDALEADR